MLEKRFIAVPPQIFIADGGVNGIITIVDTSLFKVKQEVVITGVSLPILDTVEVKRVISSTQMVIGPRGANINSVTNMSAYTVALGSAIFANEQKRPSIPLEEHERANYEEEPVVADRVILVDEMGDKYNGTNRFPVEATVNLTASKPNTHTIFNKLVTTANTEVSIILPARTEIITIMVRSNKAIRLQYSFTFGESGTRYVTVMPGVRKEITGIGLSTVTPLYFQLSLTEVGGNIVEVETWNS
jgi:hypothetical protein